MYIGEIYLPILSSIDKKSVSKITKEITGINITDPKSVSIRRNLQPVTLDGYLYNDGEKNDAQYAEDVEALQYRSAGYCYTKYADLDGFIEIDNADAPQTSEELGVRNYSIEGKYLPATKYERVVEVETEMRENEFNIEFPPHVALPVGATNVRVKTSQDSVKLSTPTFTAGNIPIYRPFPAFYPDNVIHSASDTPKYDKTAYKMSYNLLDAKDESISYTMVSGVDVPLGSYRVVLRIKADSTVNGDVKITVSDGTNNVVDSLHTLVGDGVWNIVKTASFSILQRGLTYTVTVSKATDSVSNIAINYGFLLPEKRARVAFDVAAEYDVGECKVYDTITTDAAEAGWIQVYNPEHDFAGDIVVQNSMFRWVIKQTAWKDATKVYNVTGTSPVEIGELYNKAFGDDSVAIKFKEIKPNYLKFTFELDTGNATSESTSAKEIDTVEITPFNVVIDKDVIGAYKDHYTFESTPGAMVEYENGVIAGIDANNVYGLIKSVDVTSSIDGDIIETTGSESSDSYVVPFVIPCEITTYLYKQATDLVISKDNNDIERKFWKDDFSVDSKENWDTDVGTVTVDTVNKKLVHSGVTPGLNIYLLAPSNAPVSPRKLSFICNIDPEGVNNTRYRYIRFHIGSLYIGEFRRQNNSTEYGFQLSTGSIDSIAGFSRSANGTYEPDTHVEFEIGSDNIVYGYLNGVLKLKGTLKSGVNISGAFNFGVRVSAGSSVNFEFKEVTVSPSESYTDDFTTDTVSGADGRYQAVTGTVAYDDVNKRMNVITATGANGKASGRLKSYKFTEGSQIFDVTLPTGADGDFICFATHSANGLMTDGIGVGLQSDGAGNWNLATLSGTTVTEGASSGLVDGKTARIEIEKDITGAYWYYIYDAAGAKPTTATGKLFTTLTEGYTGWYANGAGAETQTYAIDNISIRAESIVGRTNVPVEEDFWFRDEFESYDNLLRYAGYTGWSQSSDGDGTYVTSYEQWKNLHLTVASVKDTIHQLTLKNKSTGTGENTIRYYFSSSEPTATATRNGYCVIIQRLGTSNVTISKEVAGTLVNLAAASITLWDLDSVHTLTISDSMAGVISVWIDDPTMSGAPSVTVTDTTFVHTGYATITSRVGTNYLYTWEISGTRVYNKPIHRGAMLETYHDGTQEIVGTTFVDDCQWDRSVEYTKYGSVLVHDTVNACIKAAGNVGVSITYPKTGKVGRGLYFFNVKVVSPRSTNVAYPSCVFGMQSLVSNLASDGNGYYLELQYNNGGAGTFSFRKCVAGVITTIASASYTMALNMQYTIQVVWIGTTISIYVNGIYLFGATDSTYSDGYFGIYDAGSLSTATYDCRYSNIGFVATSPAASNGIAACIPPIGGGARYGVEESVYNTFTTANVDKGVYLTSAKVKTTNPNADEVSLEYVNETTSTTLDNTSIVVDADYTIKTTPITIKENETDVLTVGVKNSTTCNQPATYVESLSLIPVSGNSVLYPQDLAFISGVKPSQKRKVEVK